MYYYFIFVVSFTILFLSVLPFYKYFPHNFNPLAFVNPVSEITSLESRVYQKQLLYLSQGRGGLRTPHPLQTPLVDHSGYAVVECSLCT